MFTQEMIDHYNWLQGEGVTLKMIVGHYFNSLDISYCSISQFLERIILIQRDMQTVNSLNLFGTDGISFDIDLYMGLYNALECPNRYVTLVQYKGRPYLLAVPREIKIQDITNFLSGHSDKQLRTAKDDDVDSIIVFFDARTNMQCEDSPMGYVQLLHFAKYGDNINLSDDHKIDEKSVVTTKQQVVRFSQKWESGMYDWEPDIWNRLKDAADLEPRIELSDDYCIIEWVEIESEYGMFRRKYRVSRLRHRIERLSETAWASVTATKHPL